MQGAILITDVTNRQSYENLNRWIDEIAEFLINPIEMVLIGNKIDLAESRTVSKEDLAESAKKLGIKEIKETSAVTGEGINEVFTLMGKKILSSKLG